MALAASSYNPDFEHRIEIEKKLNQIVDRIHKLEAEQGFILEEGQTGSIVKEYVKCGKDRCKKCKEGRGHGPYTYLYINNPNGKRKKKYLGKSGGKNHIAEINRLRKELRRLEKEL